MEQLSMNERFSANGRRSAGLIAVVAWLGMIVQFGTSTANMGSFPAATWHLLLFFTIITNLGLAGTFTGLALGRPGFGNPSLLGGVTLSILLVGVVYSLLLAGTAVLTGGDKYANVIMHYAVPILTPLFWLAYVPKGGLRARSPLIWSVYPLTYLAYALTRGGIEGLYPYGFLDVSAIGWAGVLGNAAGIAAGFLIFGYLMLWLDRRLARPALGGALEAAPPGA
jgi:hypothetical protein